jgi:hypothetical protein
MSSRALSRTVGLSLPLLLLAQLGCSKKETPPGAAAPDAAASASAVAAAAPVIPRCEPTSCNDSCTCGETGKCTAGACVRGAEWKMEEVALGAGGTFGCARYANGRVQCAGQNVSAELGHATPTGKTQKQSPALVPEVTDATRLALGDHFACALAKDGRVWCWGASEKGETGAGTFEASATPRAVAGLSDAIALSTGTKHACAIRRGGSVACWGLDDRGQLGDGTKVNHAAPVDVKDVAGVTSLALATYHTCAIAKDGAVLCWGQRGGANGVASPLAGAKKADQLGVSQDEVCVGTAGKVSCFGPSMAKTLTLVPGFADATQIVGSEGLLCALRKDATVTCGDWWGASDGKVGDRAKDARLLAVGGSWECVVGKDDRIACNAALPIKSVVEQL